MKFYRVSFTMDIGIKKERIKEYEEFVKCKCEDEVAKVLSVDYGENGMRLQGKNVNIISVEEI